MSTVAEYIQSLPLGAKFTREDVAAATGYSTRDAQHLLFHARVADRTIKIVTATVYEKV